MRAMRSNWWARSKYSASNFTERDPSQPLNCNLHGTVIDAKARVSRLRQKHFDSEVGEEGRPAELRLVEFRRPFFARND